MARSAGQPQVLVEGNQVSFQWAAGWCGCGSLYIIMDVRFCARMGNQGMIKRLLRGLLPAALYGVGQEGVRRYRRQRQAAAPKLDEGACCRLLGEEMGRGPGAIVFVHSSVDRLNLDFPFFKLLGLLRQVVGAEGTLLFPASPMAERPEHWLARGEVFDSVRSPTAMGLLPEWARRQRGAVRSLHPTHSVVALGPLAEELVAEHHLDPAPCGLRSPYFKVAERGGIIVGLGVDTDILTMYTASMTYSAGAFRWRRAARGALWRRSSMQQGGRWQSKPWCGTPGSAFAAWCAFSTPIPTRRSAGASAVARPPVTGLTPVCSTVACAIWPQGA